MTTWLCLSGFSILLVFWIWLLRLGTTLTSPVVEEIELLELLTYNNMALCVNCNIALRQNQPHIYEVLDMSPELVTVLQEWITGEVSEGDCVCAECFNLIALEVDNRMSGIVGQRQLGHQCVCVGGCGNSLLRQTGRSSRLLSEGTAEYAYIANGRELPQGARICNSCWQRAHNYVRRFEVQRPMEEEQPNVSSSVSEASELPSSQSSSDAPHNEPNVEAFSLEGYSRAPEAPNRCLVPDCNNTERKRVPKYLRKKILTTYKLFVPTTARMCQTHVTMFDFDFINQYEFTMNFTPNHVVEMLDLLRDQKAHGVINFEQIERENDNICKYWTGLTIVQFLMVLASLTQLNDMCRRPRTALGLFLLRLRTGEPLRRIASLFCISTALLCSYIKKARICLTAQYVPLHLGLQHVTRELISERNLLIPRGLFGSDTNNPIVLVDGTYVYLQKSSNYLFQKKTYSLHKFANLIKPFLMVASDGYILDIFGPYAATTSDATIMSQLFQNENTSCRRFFRSNDIFILDRGFRDSLQLLNSLEYIIHKPESLDIGENQLSTQKANKSRMVTMCRWVIEVVNGRFKRDFKLFRVKYFNLATRHLMEDFRIAGALINHFHPAITDRPDAQAILNRALEIINLPNHLSEYVISRGLNRYRANFVRIDANIPQLSTFPRMEISDLILFSLGTYQLKQARSYYGEHIRAGGTFEIEVCNEINAITVPGILSSHETTLIRGRIRSRHQSSKIYYCYILYKIVGVDWRDQICRTYCSCIVGKRTLGCCAHVMTIIWYLAWARHRDNINPPAPFLDHILVREDVENEDD